MGKPKMVKKPKKKEGKKNARRRTTIQSLPVTIQVLYVGKVP